MNKQPTPPAPRGAASPANVRRVTRLLDLPDSPKQSEPAAPFKALSWGEALAQINRPAANDYRPAAMSQWLEWVARGSEQQVKEAVEQFACYRPAAAVPDLLQILFNKKLQSNNRHAALIALGLIGHPSAVPELLAQQKKLPYGVEDTFCYVLSDIADARALPYLLEQSKGGSYERRAFALFGLAQIGSPEAFASLVEDAKTELFQTYMDDDNNIFGGSSNFGLFMLGAAVGAWQNNKWTTRNATLMTNPYIPLGLVLDAPAEVRRMWQLHLRQNVLTHLVTVCGPDPLFACRAKAKQSIQRLMIAIPMLHLLGPQDEYINDLLVSSKSRFMAERLLAYEQFVYLTAQTGQPRFQEEALRGLEDKDKLLRGALAAAIIFANAAGLLPHAYEFARHKLADVRASMIAPLVFATIEGQTTAQSVVQELLQDRDRFVREQAQRIWKLGQALLAESAQAPPTPAPQPLQPALGPAPAAPPQPAPAPAGPAPATRFCMHCGQAVRSGARFCARCGQRLA